MIKAGDWKLRESSIEQDVKFAVYDGILCGLLGKQKCLNLAATPKNIF